MSDAASTPNAEAGRPPDAAPVSRIALRDGAIALAALSLWAAADAWASTSGLGFAVALSLVNGVAAGIIVTRLAHEWGHFAGARLAGGIAPTTGITTLFPIFVFDMQRSDPRAFRAMSVAGNLAHWAVVLLLALALPLDAPGRVALVSAAFGYAFYGSITELPVIRRAFSGASPLESFQGLTGEKLRRNRWIGAAAGVLVFLAAG